MIEITPDMPHTITSRNKRTSYNDWHTAYMEEMGYNKEIGEDVDGAEDAGPDEL